MKEIDVKSNKVVEQYLELLTQYQTKFNIKKLTIFMQVGDFYEIYGIIKKDIPIGNLWDISNDLILKIANKNQSVYNDKSIEVKMAGIPVLSLDKFLNSAVEDFGWTVVIISQEGEGKSIKRYEEAIVSPGTNYYSQKETNNLMTIYLEKVPSYQFKNQKTLYAGISFLDCLTGDSGIIQYPYKTSYSDSIIYDEITKLITIKNPAEIIIYTKNLDITSSELEKLLYLYTQNYIININVLPLEYTKKGFQETLFNNIYTNKKSIESIFQYLNVYDYPTGRISLVILLDYIVKRNFSILEKIQKPTLMYDIDNNLVLANNALEQLNIISNIKKTNYYQNITSLYDILNKTKTMMGKRLLKNRLMNPITDHKILQNRYSVINNILTLDAEEEGIKKISSFLMNMIDIKKITRLICRNKLYISNLASFHETMQKTLVLIKYLDKYKKHKELFALIPQEIIKHIKTIIEDIDTTFDLEQCRTLISKLDINIFKKGVHSELDELQRKIDIDTNLLDLLCEKLTRMIDDKTYQKDKKYILNKGQNSKYNHYIYTTQARADALKKIIQSPKFGYLEVGHYKLYKKDFNFDLISKNKVRLDLECIQASGNNLVYNTMKLRKAIYSSFYNWCSDIYNKYSDTLEKLNNFISEIDFYQSSALIAKNNKYICPMLDITNDNSFLDVKDIRHPLIEKIQTDIEYIANDVMIGEDKNGILLFGINAVGKSSYMKSVGVNIIMAQAGMFVAASEFKFKPFKYLFTRIQSSDNIFAGLSTFAVEMSEFKIILKYADKNSIILGDELCSGTETLDATALVTSGIEELSRKKANFIFATHLHYLSQSEYINKLDNVQKVHMSVFYNRETNKLEYERKLKDGSGPSSYGIEVCKAMDMDTGFLERAQEIRNGLSDNSQKIIGKQSKYNNDKFIAKCEVCLTKPSVDTHHIKFQCTANPDGMINTYHKDSKFNLVGLCKECHKDVHSSPPILKIDGYIMTNEGITLKWEKLTRCLSPNKIELIKDMLSQNMSIRQIQNRLRTEFNLKVKQEEIKNIT